MRYIDDVVYRLMGRARIFKARSAPNNSLSYLIILGKAEIIAFYIL